MSFRLGTVRDSVTVPIYPNVQQEEASEEANKRYEAGQMPDDEIYKSFYITGRAEWASTNGNAPDPLFYLHLNRMTRGRSKKIAGVLDAGETLVQRNRRGDAVFAKRTLSNIKQLEAQDSMWDVCIAGWDDVFNKDTNEPLACNVDSKCEVIEQVPGLGDFILAFCRDSRNFGEDKVAQEKKDTTSDATLPS